MPIRLRLAMFGICRYIEPCIGIAQTKYVVKLSVKNLFVFSARILHSHNGVPKEQLRRGNYV